MNFSAANRNLITISFILYLEKPPNNGLLIKGAFNPKLLSGL